MFELIDAQSLVYCLVKFKLEWSFILTVFLFWEPDVVKVRIIDSLLCCNTLIRVQSKHLLENFNSCIISYVE